LTERPRHWVRLHDMLDSIDGIRQAVAGRTYDEFLGS